MLVRPMVERRLAQVLVDTNHFYACGTGPSSPQPPTRLTLRPCPIPGTDEEMRCGTLEVHENRETREGRRIALNIAVLPARTGDPRPDPVFFLVGGPGGAATRRAAPMKDSWMRSERDVVLVDQRGTGRSNPLTCELAGGPGNVQGYLRTGFGDLEALRRCRDELEEIADLERYGLPTAMDDLDDVRRALGYGKVNIVAGSWGTRAALIYLRRHPGSVRAVLLNGIAPPALVYGLYMAQSSQRSLDLVLDQCAADPACHERFPGLKARLTTVMDRLEDGPVDVEIRDPHTGEPVIVELSREAFAEGLRYLLASTVATRWVPLVIDDAYQGEFGLLAQDLVDTNHFYKDRLAMGMLLSVLCPEDVARVDRGAIEGVAEGTFLGGGRLRQIVTACETWPGGEIPASYADPIASDVPALLWSGALDPFNAPEWGEEAARHLENGLHVVVPGSHIARGACVDGINRAFLDRGSIDGLDTTCLADVVLPPFVLEK
jgi:pimeloyl-ACP methyl ester carboxylesterase